MSRTIGSCLSRPGREVEKRWDVMVEMQLIDGYPLVDMSPGVGVPGRRSSAVWCISMISTRLHTNYTGGVNDTLDAGWMQAPEFQNRTVRPCATGARNVGPRRRPTERLVGSRFAVSDIAD